MFMCNKLCYIILCVVANYVTCVLANYVGVFDSIKFAITHIAFLVNICVANKNANMCICCHTCCIFSFNIYVATKNATCVFAILVANYIGVFDSKLS
jgi:hypothetical protein